MAWTKPKRITCRWFLLPAFCLTLAQGLSSEFVYVESIGITGNKKTKSDLILREIDFRAGDSLRINELTLRLDRNEQLLMNTGLFNAVEINIEQWDESAKSIHLVLAVTESWYIFPLPIFNLADRNFNVWWTEQDRSLKRVNYGVRLIYYNFSGNKDKLKLTFQAGYKRKVLLQYDRPYLNRKKTMGVTGRVFIDHRREFPFETRFNKRQFYEDESQITSKSFKAIFSFHYRPRVESFHEVFLKYENNNITDEIFDLNTNYFNGATRLRFYELSYFFRRERRDSRFYALAGNYIQAEAKKTGLGIHNQVDKLTTSLLYAHYVPITQGVNIEARVKGQVEWTGNAHPYYGFEALGFGEDYIRGYELYVVDGTDFFLTRNSLRFKLLNKSIDLKRKMPLHNYRILPIMLWFTVNADAGIVDNTLFNEDNPFNNRWLYGGGIGLDIILYQKYVFQVEYSMNHLREKGLFLHIRTDL